MRAAALLLAALSTGTVAQPPAPQPVFHLAIAAGKVAGDRVLRVRQGATVEIHLASDAPGEAHLHGYRLAAKLAPGRDARWRFIAHASGRFRIEWHRAAGAEAHSHGPPLASLEVLPP